MTKENYRIVEVINGFYIQKKVIEKKTYGIWPFKKYIFVERWASIDENYPYRRIIIIPKLYPTFEKAKSILDDIVKYPIYHYLEK